MTSAPAPVGIVSTGLCYGERTLSPDELVRLLDVPVETVKRWTGGEVVYSSERKVSELGAEAGRIALGRAGVDASDVDYLIWCGSSVHRGRPFLQVQDLLGATRAAAIALATNCTELITAIRIGSALIRTETRTQRVLIVCGEQRQSEPRILGLDKNLRYQPIFSDGGGALLLARGGAYTVDQVTDATDGAYAEYIQQLRTSKVDRTQNTLADNVRLYSTALARCLEANQITADDIASILCTNEGPRVVETMLRTMQLPFAKLFRPPNGPSHMGVVDHVIALEALAQQALLRPGDRVLMVTRTAGIMRNCVLTAR